MGLGLGGLEEEVDREGGGVDGEDEEEEPRDEAAEAVSVAMSSARHHRRRRAAGVSRRSKGCRRVGLSLSRGRGFLRHKKIKRKKKKAEAAAGKVAGVLGWSDRTVGISGWAQMLYPSPSLLVVFSPCKARESSPISPRPPPPAGGTVTL